MPGTRCNIATCNNSRVATRKTDQNIMYHRFPKDKNIRDIWIQKCKRDGKWNYLTCYVCSVHFIDSDYERDLQSELLGIPKRKLLKKDAVPSVNLPHVKENSSTNERTMRLEKRARKILVKNMLHANSNEECCTSTSQEIQENMTIIQQNKTVDENLEMLKLKVAKLEEANSKLQLENKTLQNELQDKIILMEQHKQELNLEKKEQGKRLKVNVNSEIKNILSQCFTSCQIDMLITKKKSVRWNDEDISRAFTLRYFSKRAYIYLRQTLHYPLPSISSLQRWASNINMRSGILVDVLKFLEIAGRCMTDQDKVTVISFDEIKVAELYEFDQKNDQVVGPCHQMQAVMARGLFSKWKLPVFVDFDQKMTTEILNKIIVYLHRLGFNVIACVSDCGGSNIGLWKALNISVDNTSFKHPITKDKIYMLADAPHLLKLIRNWLIDTGFKLKDGSIVNKEPLEALLNLTNTEINSCHNLTENHITCEGPQRQKVLLAAQLLSNTTAKALSFYCPGENKELAKATSSFIGIVNAWFDITNSFVPQDSISTKCAYGKHLELQNEHLDAMYDMTLNMICLRKRSLQVFQKGILISIKSLKNLFLQVKEKYKIDYVLTHRLNQDVLENLFSQLRTRGGLNDHPTPLNTLYRLRMIILGKSMHLKSSNTQDKGNDEFITGQVLVRAGIKSPKQDPEVENLSSNDLSIYSDLDEAEEDAVNLSTIQQSTEEDGLFYLAGWIAKKLKKSHPNLGDYTYKIADKEHSHTFPTWIRHLSFGGLIQPSETWQKQIKGLETSFNRIFGKTVNYSKDINKKVCLQIAEESNIDPTIIKIFVRQRIFIRINYLNVLKSKAQIKKYQNKRPRTDDESRKTVKKMKKIIQ